MSPARKRAGGGPEYIVLAMKSPTEQKGGMRISDVIKAKSVRKTPEGRVTAGLGRLQAQARYWELSSLPEVRGAPEQPIIAWEEFISVEAAESCWLREEWGGRSRIPARLSFRLHLQSDCEDGARQRSASRSSAGGDAKRSRWLERLLGSRLSQRAPASATIEEFSPRQQRSREGLLPLPAKRPAHGSLTALRERLLAAIDTQFQSPRLDGSSLHPLADGHLMQGPLAGPMLPPGVRGGNSQLEPFVGRRRGKGGRLEAATAGWECRHIPGDFIGWGEPVGGGCLKSGRGRRMATPRSSQTLVEDGIFLKSLGLFASIKEEREPKLLRLVRYPASLHWWMEDLWLWVLPRRWSSRPYHLPEELPTELPQCWVATLPFRPASPRCMDLIVPVWQQIRVARSILEAVVEVGSDEQETLVLLMAEATSEQSRAFESTDGFVRGLLRRRMQMTSYEQDFADNHPVAHLLRYLRLVDQLSERLACDRCSTKQPLRTRTAPVASSSSPSSSPLSSSSSATPSSSSSGMGQRWSVDGSIEEFMMLEGCLPISTDGFRPPPTAQEWQPAEEERITKRCYRYPFLPFERSLAEEALRCLDTHRGCCVVLEHAVPTLGLGALLIMEFLRSHAAGRRAVVWIVGEEEADACRCLLGRVLEQEGPLGDAAISFWSWSTFSRHPDPLPPVDLLVISRFSFNDQVRHLERVRAGRTVAFSGWPASCSSDLYRAMGLLGISKIVARRSDHVALEAQRSAWFRPQLLDDQRIGQVLASCKARLSELSEVVRREGLAPDGWIESLPGSEEFELALAALAEEAPEHPLVPVLKALCVLVGVMDRLLHQGAQAADEFLEECQPLGSGNAVELPLLSRLAKEAQARIAPSFLSQVFQQVASSHGYRSTLVVVDANLARDAVVASADDIPRGASLLLGPASLEELATVAYRGGIAVIQAKCLPNIEGLFGSDLIGLWPFDRVVDFTSRWKGYAFLANQLLREPAERTVACARVRLAAAPQDTHRWIGHFQAGCPGGQVEEIAFLDYEIVFSDPPLTMVPSKPNPISPTNHKSTKPSTIKPLKNARMGSSFTSILNRADRNVGGEGNENRKRREYPTSEPVGLPTHHSPRSGPNLSKRVTASAGAPWRWGAREGPPRKEPSKIGRWTEERGAEQPSSHPKRARVNPDQLEQDHAYYDSGTGQLRSKFFRGWHPQQDEQI